MNTAKLVAEMKANAAKCQEIAKEWRENALDQGSSDGATRCLLYAEKEIGSAETWLAAARLVNSQAAY